LALTWLDGICLHVRFDHIDRVNHHPEQDAGQAACHHGRGDRNLITRDAECFETLLHNVFVCQEIDAHAVTFTEESGSHATKYARYAGLLHDLADTIKGTTYAVALLRLHSNTHMLNGSSHPAVGNTAQQTGRILLQRCDLLGRTLLGIHAGEKALAPLNNAKLNRYASTYTNQWHGRALVKGQWAFVTQNVRDTVQNATICAMGRSLHTHFHDIKWLTHQYLCHTTRGTGQNILGGVVQRHVGASSKKCLGTDSESACQACLND